MPETADHRSDEPDRLSKGFEPVTPMEWGMVSLAVIDVLLLFGREAYAAFLPSLVQKLVVPIDLGILALFAVEFLSRLARANRKVVFVRNHWYDVVGLVPISSVTFRLFRLVRILRIYVVTRLDWEAEPGWHQALVRGLVRQYLDVLLQELTAPIMFAGVQMVKAPLKEARFAALMGNVLDTQRSEVHAVVNVTLKNTKGMKTVSQTKAGQQLTQAVTEAVLDTVVESLRSDEMNHLVANATEDVLNEVTASMTGADVPVDQALEQASPARV